MTEHKFGYVAFAGIPNVGKSTLLNSLMQQKISIISKRPQTTRHRILGIVSGQNHQIAFVDIPGIEPSPQGGLDRVIRKTAINCLSDVDLILFMIDHKGWHEGSKKALKDVCNINKSILLVINKIDKFENKAQLLPLIQQSSTLHEFTEIIPIQATNLPDPDQFCAKLTPHLPAGSPGFPSEMRTDRNREFQASEFIREQTYLLLGQELPYSISVEITQFETNNKNVLHIDATIWVEKSSQKSIVIGKQGNMLKKIGTGARLQIEKSFSQKVYLSLWVKVKKSWSDRDKELMQFGYTES
ncbi:MAG: GTPase Era [Gammaproteobacteria bacterium]|nr:GTPase Era [Gammaproteobacteria bacterium]MCY4219627.1 GTPase Era [Gammaproteobacteria bacterium]MCY4275470.1 GTPase Era [Gammaproteobacteria bacterium]